MGREAVRELKRLVSMGNKPNACEGAAESGKDASLRLLARSVAFGHRRLAVIRLIGALEAGAQVSADVWQYCTNDLRDRRLVDALGRFEPPRNEGTLS